MSTQDEGRDMWRVYLDKGDYAVALSNCRSPYQRDQVYLVQVTLCTFTLNATLISDKISYSFEEVPKILYASILIFERGGFYGTNIFCSKLTLKSEPSDRAKICADQSVGS